MLPKSCNVPAPLPLWIFVSGDSRNWLLVFWVGQHQVLYIILSELKLYIYFHFQFCGATFCAGCKSRRLDPGCLRPNRQLGHLRRFGVHEIRCYYNGEVPGIWCCPKQCNPTKYDEHDAVLSSVNLWKTVYRFVSKLFFVTQVERWLPMSCYQTIIIIIFFFLPRHDMIKAFHNWMLQFGLWATIISVVILFCEQTERLQIIPQRLYTTYILFIEAYTWTKH